jgi:hypothetical protein
MQGKLLRQVLDKMMTSGYAQNARVQVLLPDGKYYDITSLQLLENKLIGVRETHRLVFTVQSETVLDACLKVPKLYEGLMHPGACSRWLEA